jgi:UDP-N-acetylglucosamine--N-acetylmuramyl-(pentapeptide) pyrophosphoryl-undecaprenol N-acetylglucosamine transferase
MPYIEDMDMAYAASDWGLTRAGALTLAELAVVGLPVILVPFPYAAEDHQMHNARAMEKEGAAIVVKDTKEYSTELRKKILNLYEDIDLREKMSESIKRFAIADAADRIIQSVYNLWMERR